MIKLTHEASRVGGIGPDLAVDFDKTLLGNRKNLTTGQSILQPVTEEDGKGKGFPELVGTRRGTGSLFTHKLLS